MDIELRHICKRFGALQANDDINIAVKGGRIVGILGENGAGKSTLMKILSGYQPADSGEILLNGKTARYRSPQGAIAAGIGMLQQDPLDVPAFTVLENFVYGQPTGLLFSQRAARADMAEICSRFGFQLDPDAPISSLSIGQRQQSEIVRLLALGVKTLILDEPTTGISDEQKSILFGALRDLAHAGMSVLLVSHKLEDVIALCDEVVVLRAGRLVGAAHMPITKAELVSLMFGQELAAQARERLAPGDEVLLLDEVTLRGKRVTVEHFTMQICAGEVIGLAGLEDSGQELVLRACAGLVRPARGRVFVGKHDMTHKAYRQFMAEGVAFGAAGRLEEGLIAGLTLTEHIALTMNKGALLDWGGARQTTDEKLLHYNVRGKPESRIEQLSGGNQQRMLMAMLPERPHLLALEQPTRGLDVDSARWIWEQLLARRAAGAAILFTSPDFDELTSYSDRIYVAHAGVLTQIKDATKTNTSEMGRIMSGDHAH